MIGIIAAMDMEVEAILQEMQAEKKELYGLTFYQGSLQGKEVVVGKSGVGKVNAAMATFLLLTQFPVDKVINIGTAGGVKADQQILDAIISEVVVQHDYDTSPIDGVSGVGLTFQADAKLASACLQVLHDMQVSCHFGWIASGDQFIAEEKQLTQLLNRFPKVICAEMEAGAIAQVCTHMQIPFVVLRSLSDVAIKQDSHMDFLEYAKHASKRSALFCKELMRLL